jgi:hypothetical protein
MSREWYEIIDSDCSLTQGDIIFNCPLVSWKAEKISLEGKESKEVLQGATEVISADVIVLSQACDLENNKISNVILCPHLDIDEYKKAWETTLTEQKQTPNLKSWRRHLKDIRDGFIWNLSLLNCLVNVTPPMQIRIVDFHNIYSLPRIFLESLLGERKKTRIRLSPPYREHLSQSFARFFMRVGLPIPIEINN